MVLQILWCGLNIACKDGMCVLYTRKKIGSNSKFIVYQKKKRAGSGKSLFTVHIPQVKSTGHRETDK